MSDGCPWVSMGQGKIMGIFCVQMVGEHVMEYVGAHLPQQIVFGLKMSVKCTAPHIGFVNDLLYGDFSIAFLR